MNPPTTTAAARVLPLPARQFQRFIAVFHVVFLGALAFILFARWWRPDRAWDWRDATLLGLVVAQVALYLRFFLRPFAWPLKRRSWAFYFAASLGIWLAESEIEPAFSFAVWAYIGQMLGVLPPRISLPVAGAVLLIHFWLRIGWHKLAGLQAWEWFGGLGLIVTFTTLGLFLHRLTATSEERARLILDLETARRELELARQRDAELAVLRERERLARDLHDSLGHSLVTLTVQLEAAQRLLATDPTRALPLLAEMQKLSRASMEGLRRSLANLRAPGLGDRSLGQALRDLCDEVARRSGVNIDHQLADDMAHLSPVVAEGLWRVAQEALRNAGKHAQARHVRVSLMPQPKEVLLRVIDDGKGLPPGAEDTPGHYGVRGMRERVEGLGGTFTLATDGIRGTAIEVRVPLITR
jgi:signal transduction histidine kinase